MNKIHEVTVPMETIADRFNDIRRKGVDPEATFKELLSTIARKINGEVRYWNDFENRAWRFEFYSSLDSLTRGLKQLCSINL